MGRITARLLEWDLPSRLALGLAVVLLLIERQPAIICFFGLVVVLQIIVMWANRSMITPYTQAQRLYLTGDFERAREILEGLRDKDKADFRALTLLGNAYRQLGELDASEMVLREALTISPNHHFPLYGFGRTLLVQGRYAEAADFIGKAAAEGAPPVVQLDAGEALYRQGAGEEASALLQINRQLAQEPYRALMADYLLYQLGIGEVPTRALLETGLSYWQASAERFRHTAYGQALAKDIRLMQTWIGER
jgi:tetratricopeptide (TPR) repeat protein